MVTTFSVLGCLVLDVGSNLLIRKSNWHCSPDDKADIIISSVTYVNINFLKNNNNNNITNCVSLFHRIKIHILSYNNYSTL